jgi:hypothetical protein
LPPSDTLRNPFEPPTEPPAAQTGSVVRGSLVSLAATLGFMLVFLATMTLCLGVPFAAVVAGSDAPIALRISIIPLVAGVGVACLAGGRALERRRLSS